MKFLCDQMLGSLAKWLRVFGFDTYYANRKIKDSELIKIAKTENRVLITRDKELIFDAKRENLQVIKIESKDLDEQIKKVLFCFKPDPKKHFTRCILCNSLLEDMNEDKVKNKIPETILEKNEKFLYCKKCDKTYWQGTHYKKMLSKIKQLKN
jgi:uncharacterized protein